MKLTDFLMSWSEKWFTTNQQLFATAKQKETDTMRTSKDGIDIITFFEGFESHPYQDSVGVWTIGYGTTFYPNGVKVKPQDKPVTIEQAEQYLRDNLKIYEAGVDNLMQMGGVTLTQNEYDALVSFAYNLGVSALSRSTLWKVIVKYKKGQVKAQDVTAQFLRWNKAGGKILNGLTARRKKEAELFTK